MTMGEEKKIEIEEVDAVDTPPRARVTPEFERKRDYLAGFLAEMISLVSNKRNEYLIRDRVGALKK